MTNKSITTSKKVVTNTILNVLNLIVTTVIGFLMIPFFIRKLGADVYGIWVLIASIFTYSMILEVGLNSALNRYIAVYAAKQDTEGMSKALSTALMYYWVIAIVAILATFVGYHYLDSWFSIPKELIGSARKLLLIVGFTLFFSRQGQVSAAVISGLQQTDKEVISGLIPTIIRTILLFVLLSRGYGLLTMGVLFGLSQIATNFFRFIYARKILHGFKVSYKYVDFKLFKEMLAYGINSFMYAVGALIIAKSSDVIIGVFLTTTDITRYSVTIAAVMVLNRFLQAFLRSVKPAVSDLDARDDHKKVGQIALLSQKYSLILLIPSLSFLLIMGKDFLQVWLGSKYTDLSLILSILAVAHFLRLAQHSSYMVLVGKGEHKVFGVLTITMALSAICLAVISIKVFHMGLFGIAISNFIPMVLTSGVILPIYARKKLGISFKYNMLSVWIPAFAGCLPAIILIALWKWLLPPNSWVGLSAVIISAGILTVVGAWFVSFTPLERNRFRGLLVPRFIRI